ncbi:hypothetical protein GCM10010269_14230 [Streptomyces humidus]|uniref:Uncharacterized protein n=1 Tax=Streptomyces humidus TaxID=52259 RepID=A0A918L1M2_9ACTN|nr:hypothetical protein GCM10010269_14230 [Streptomyces humidus]
MTGGPRPRAGCGEGQTAEPVAEGFGRGARGAKRAPVLAAGEGPRALPHARPSYSRATVLLTRDRRPVHASHTAPVALLIRLLGGAPTL